MGTEVVLVTGGVKSGKSAWALALGERRGRRRAFLATAAALDGEMSRRIHLHRQERGSRWETFEEPRNLAACLRDLKGRFDVVLVDCLTLWVSNLITQYDLDEAAVAREFELFGSELSESAAGIILVTNEVGMGIVPADALSRRYQRLLGALNRQTADSAGSVYMMISGIAQKIK